MAIGTYMCSIVARTYSQPITVLRVQNFALRQVILKAQLWPARICDGRGLQF